MPMLTRRLGRTDHLSSIAILGGAAFWNTSAADTEAAFELAIASGVNHIDIAPSYGNAELAAGPLVASHRDQLFVAEKSGRKNPDGLRSELETSLERLGCDQFDLYQAHGVTDLAELDRRSDAIEAILLARDEGLTRFVGITGHDHGTPAAQLAALRRFDLDTVMFPIYPGVMNNAQYAHDVAALLHECAERDTGVMAIKSVAHQPWGDRPKTKNTWYEPFSDHESIRRGIRFVLSTPGVHAICTPGDVSLLPNVFATTTAFEPMTDAERDAALHDGADWPTVFPLAEHARG
jgi:aryl-alcohol dehydrogenase-like predicted oxidoreductase